MTKEVRSKLSKVTHFIMGCLLVVSPIGYVVQVTLKHKQEAEFAMALSSAGAGRWTWHIKDGSLKWDDGMFLLFGRSKANWSPTLDGFLACVSEADRKVVEELCRKAIKERGTYQAVYTIVTEDGSTRLIRASGRSNPEGTILTGICLPSMQDLTIK